MTYCPFENIVNRVKFRDWELFVGKDNSRSYLQVRFIASCNNSGKSELQSCRKWFLSPHMTETEVINTCWLAIRQAVEHETMEQFTVDGIRLMDPHLSVSDRLRCVKTGSKDVRKSKEN